MLNLSQREAVQQACPGDTSAAKTAPDSGLGCARLQHLTALQRRLFGQHRVDRVIYLADAVGVAQAIDRETSQIRTMNHSHD